MKVTQAAHLIVLHRCVIFVAYIHAHISFHGVGRQWQMPQVAAACATSNTGCQCNGSCPQRNGAIKHILRERGSNYDDLDKLKLRLIIASAVYLAWLLTRMMGGNNHASPSSDNDSFP
jgi:hypothetical protein